MAKAELSGNVQIRCIVKYRKKLFELRSNGANTLDGLKGSLSYLKSQHGGLRGLPLKLVGWVKSTKASAMEPFACMAFEMQEQPAEGRAGRQPLRRHGSSETE